MRIFVWSLVRGSEPLAEEAVQLICETGGLAVLAHPWALKNPIPIIRRLKDAGLHGMEVYRSDGRLAGIIFAVLISSSLTHMLLHIHLAIHAIREKKFNHAHRNAQLCPYDCKIWFYTWM